MKRKSCCANDENSRTRTIYKRLFSYGRNGERFDLDIFIYKNWLYFYLDFLPSRFGSVWNGGKKSKRERLTGEKQERKRELAHGTARQSPGKYAIRWSRFLRAYVLSPAFIGLLISCPPFYFSHCSCIFHFNSVRFALCRATGGADSTHAHTLAGRVRDEGKRTQATQGERNEERDNISISKEERNEVLKKCKKSQHTKSDLKNLSAVEQINRWDSLVRELFWSSLLCFSALLLCLRRPSADWQPLREIQR